MCPHPSGGAGPGVCAALPGRPRPIQVSEIFLLVLKAKRVGVFGGKSGRHICGFGGLSLFFSLDQGIFQKHPPTKFWL